MDVRTRRRTTLLGLTLLAAVLRLPTLGEQSLWSDEAATAAVLDVAFGDLLAAVRDSESTPPLHYLLSWPVVEILGEREWTLRLVPALCSIATVPVLALVGDRLGGERALTASGLLAATAPLLVWFGQEARAYALVVLLCSVATLALLDRRAVLWGVAAAAALATHYFAVFLLAPQAGLLAWRSRDEVRRLAAAFAVPLVSGLALLGLAADQRDADRAAFIGDIPLPERLAAAAKQAVSGYDAPFEVVLTAAAAVLVVAGLAGLRGVDRQGLAAVLAVALVLPVAAAVAGDDYVLTRNLLPVAAVAVPLLGAGLARTHAAVPAALAVVWTVTVIGVALEPSSQREDWRAALRAAPAAGGARVIAVLPPSGRVAVLHYTQDSAVRTLGGVAPVDVREVDLVQMASGARGGTRELPPPLTAPPAAGFRKARVIDRGEGWRVTRWRAARPSPVLAPQLADAFPSAALLLERPGRPGR